MGNAYVQGTAALVLFNAGNRLRRLYRQHRARLIIPVHDAFVFESPGRPGGEGGRTNEVRAGQDCPGMVPRSSTPGSGEHRRIPNAGTTRGTITVSNGLSQTPWWKSDPAELGGAAKEPLERETVASFLEFFRPRTGLMQGLRGLCAIGRLLIPLHVQGDTLANVFSRPH